MLPLALALLLCLAFCIATIGFLYNIAESRTDGRSQEQRANDGQCMWCIAEPCTDNLGLYHNINYSCGQNGVDCGPIQPGGSCFHPDTAFPHASYAMNLFYKAAGKHPMGLPFQWYWHNC